MNTQNINEDIFLNDLLKAIWQGKFLILGITSIASILILIYSLSIDNFYRSEAIIFPSNNEDGRTTSLAGYAGIANMVGINLPNMSSSSSKEALRIMESFAFFQTHIKPNIFLPDLFAFQFWNPLTNENGYDANIYDIDKQKWTRKTSYPSTLIPSDQEAFRLFKKHFSVNEDKIEGFHQIAVEHNSPFIAKQWLSIILEGINFSLREKEKKKTELSISFLTKQLEATTFSDIKIVLNQLMKSELEKLLLIERDDQYVFKIIEAPIVPEIKAGPNRAIICIIGAAIGMIIGFLFSVVYYLSGTRK